MLDKPISVTQLSTYIRDIFNAEEMLYNVSVFGEVSGISYSRGICYFTLKDDNAILPCICFESEKLATVKEGDSIIVKGNPNYYIKGGKLNFNVSTVIPYGAGLIYKNFLELKQKLELEGLFDSSNKKTIPTEISTIGVVTSSTGAVFQDIINVSTRRNPNINIILSPCKVQGLNAEKEIVKAIKKIDDVNNVDVIIVARGGGSIEDLSAYNTELVARAISGCKKPVISAVGHETDFTISDFVADMRAPTPSAAAELVTSDLTENKYRLLKDINRLINSNKFLLYKETTFINNRNAIYKEYDKIVRSSNQYVNNSIQKMIRLIQSCINNREYQLDIANKNLEKFNPELIYKLGYAKIIKNNSRVTSVHQLSTYDNISIILNDGEVDAKVNKIVRR